MNPKTTNLLLKGIVGTVLVSSTLGGVVGLYRISFPTRIDQLIRRHTNNVLLSDDSSDSWNGPWKRFKEYGPKSNYWNISEPYSDSPPESFKQKCKENSKKMASGIWADLFLEVFYFCTVS
ncbi:hypothetical protein MHC_03410 [Mycoplasma haemocanis str. Illinois]|uniref:Uncharacterized protein n=1 Tax=Mycoplasma haemocanis (strain Illinois) TaxID=1111676 RepID=H6N7C0_MYCHN|nr:hypothetical protein [Mycoplasma haemocanis]AEW45542.1 hypothetical protein MHC_03410 [Mycoplasma haemocanis str. Illinois]